MEIEDILMRNEQLVLENEALRQQIEDLKNGFEGCCPACEPVGEMNKKLRDERDEARRIACENEAAYNGMMFDNPKYSDPIAVMRERGWNCFREKS